MKKKSEVGSPPKLITGLDLAVMKILWILDEALIGCALGNGSIALNLGYEMETTRRGAAATCRTPSRQMERQQGLRGASLPFRPAELDRGDQVGLR